MFWEGGRAARRLAYDSLKHTRMSYGDIEHINMSVGETAAVVEFQHAECTWKEIAELDHTRAGDDETDLRVQMHKIKGNWHRL